MTKTLLSTLSITTRPINNNSDPIIQRQTKLIARLEEQREIARCLLENETFSAYKEVTITDEDNNKSKVKLPKRVKPWFYSVKGSYFLEVRYGSKPIELAKSKYAITVGAKGDLLKVIDTVIDAVRAGELDTQLSTFTRTASKSNV